MAEADGNRTRLTEILGHVGFEDRGGHQAPLRLPRRVVSKLGAQRASRVPKTLWGDILPGPPGRAHGGPGSTSECLPNVT